MQASKTVNRCGKSYLQPFRGLHLVAATIPVIVYAVRCYGRQMWAGKSECDADRIISEYARLGQVAVKRKVRINS